jgi:hypothetical protein
MQSIRQCLGTVSPHPRIDNPRQHGGRDLPLEEADQRHPDKANQGNGQRPLPVFAHSATLLPWAYVVAVEPATKL